MAKELEYDGIELHNISDPALSATGAPFSIEYISSTARRIASAKLTIACVDSVSDIADAEKTEEAFEEISKCIAFATKVRSPYVRIRAAVNTPDSDKVDEAVNTLIKKLQHLSVTYHKEIESGRIQSKFLRDIEAIEFLNNQGVKLEGIAVISNVKNAIWVDSNNVLYEVISSVDVSEFIKDILAKNGEIAEF